MGKTCFLLRFAHDDFTSSHLTTLGINFELKNIQVDGTYIKLQIWDTAGQERFRTITQSYYKAAMGFILAYDCTDENSFNNIEYWVQQIKIHAIDNVPKVLVGNKCDCSDKKISSEQGEALAKELSMEFFETSAKSNINVDETFYFIAKEIKDKGLSKGPGPRDAIDLRNSQLPQKKGCC